VRGGACGRGGGCFASVYMGEEKSVHLLDRKGRGPGEKKRKEMLFTSGRKNHQTKGKAMYILSETIKKKKRDSHPPREKKGTKTSRFGKGRKEAKGRTGRPLS